MRGTDFKKSEQSGKKGEFGSRKRPLVVHINVSTFLIWSLYRAIYSIWLRLKDTMMPGSHAKLTLTLILIRDVS